MMGYPGDIGEACGDLFCSENATLRHEKVYIRFGNFDWIRIARKRMGTRPACALL